MWERLQQDIERLRNEKTALVVSGKEALTRAKAEAADELQRVRRYAPLYCTVIGDHTPRHHSNKTQRDAPLMGALVEPPQLALSLILCAGAAREGGGRARPEGREGVAQGGTGQRGRKNMAHQMRVFSLTQSDYLELNSEMRSYF